MNLIALSLITSFPLVDVSTYDPRLTFDIRYATTANFTGIKLYPIARCLLRPEVAAMLKKAEDTLVAADFGLLLKDCYRPISVQRRMWEVVQGTPQEPYVTNPNSKYGSVHNYGAAVDVTLQKSGKEVDMGTPYDHLGKLAEPRHEADFLRTNQLTQSQVDNRKILRAAMLAAGFKSIQNEWWHFDALRGEALRKTYAPLDIALGP